MKDTFTKLKMVFFSLMTVSMGVGAIMVGWVTFFATDYLGLAPVTIGLLFMLSKIFDGVTDLIAGFIIDKTHSPLGKGRPFDLAMIGYWACVILMFLVPIMGKGLTYAWIFIMFTLANSVFQTLLSCANTAYMANVIDRPDQTLLTNAITGIISMIVSTAGGVMLPQLAATMGTSREGWGKIALILGIPALMIGMLRFFLVKEKANRREHMDVFRFKDTVTVVTHNKYIVMVALVILVSNIGYYSISGVTSYYCTYILGDVGVASVMSLVMLSTVISLILTPILAPKIGLAKFIRILSVLAIGASLARLIAPTNLVLQLISGFMIVPGFLTTWLYLSTFTIDCIDYGEWNTGIRSEGSTTCIPSFCSKVGSAFGSGLVGVLMGLSGYNGSLTVQPASAQRMLIVMFSVIPAIFGVIQYVVLRFYDLDAKIPEIRKQLAEKNG